MEALINNSRQAHTLIKSKVENGFITFNRLLNTVVIEGHMEIEHPFDGRHTLERFLLHLRPQDALKFVIRLDVLNIPTTQCLFQLFQIAKQHAPGQIRVCWVCSHEDQQMIETGLDLCELYDLKVTVLPV